MKDEWHEDLPIVERGDIANPNTKLQVQILEATQTQFDLLEIGFNPELGNIMFLGGEIQISESDYEHYHQFILNSLQLSLFDTLLVVGDGDGGFTKFGNWIDIDIVDRDTDVIKAGTKYFGADWSKVNLKVMSVEDFTPIKQYDAIYYPLVVAPGFDSVALTSELNRIWGWLKPGGKLIGQASMITDPYFLKTFITFEEWCHKNDIDHQWLSTPIKSFFARENFFVGVK